MTKKQDRKERLRVLAIKNASKLERVKIIDKFINDLAEQVSMDVQNISIESYDDSLKILKNGWPILTEIVEDSEGINSGYIDKKECSLLIQAIEKEFDLDFAYLLRIDKYKSIGALKLQLRRALKLVIPLFDIGEERVCIVSKDFKSSIYIEYEKNDYDELKDYLLIVQGKVWEEKLKKVVFS